MEVPFAGIPVAALEQQRSRILTQFGVQEHPDGGASQG